MNNKLITALRTAASALESGRFSYSWSNPASCNCGVLACSLLGKSMAGMTREVDFFVHDRNKNATWRHNTGVFCPITGIPENTLFRTLFSFGLTTKDFGELEYLSNPEVLARFPLVPQRRKWWQFRVSPPQEISLNYKNANDAAIYMRVWANLLEERGKDDQPEPVTNESEPATA